MIDGLLWMYGPFSLSVKKCVSKRVLQQMQVQDGWNCNGTWSILASTVHLRNLVVTRAGERLRSRRNKQASDRETDRRSVVPSENCAFDPQIGLLESSAAAKLRTSQRIVWPAECGGPHSSRPTRSEPLPGPTATAITMCSG